MSSTNIPGPDETPQFATEHPWPEDDSCPLKKIAASQVPAVCCFFLTTYSVLITTCLFPKKRVSVGLHNSFVVVEFFLQTSSDFKFKNYSPKWWLFEGR